MKRILFLLITALSFGLAFGQTYDQITAIGDLTDGDYLIVGDGTTNDGLMKNTTTGSVLIGYTSISNPGASISSGYTSDNVFTITVSGGNITIYNSSIGYASWGRSGATGNDADFYNGTVDDTERWTPSVSGGLWSLANVSASSRILQWNNDAPRFVAYTSTQVKLKLYKLNTPSGNTATFDANGGSGTMADQIASASTALNLNTFTRTGFDFTGWNTLANGLGTSYADGANYSFSADETFYAQWVAVPTITVTPNTLTGLDYAFGSGPSTEQSFDVEGTLLLAGIDITAPSDFLISRTSGGPYTSTVNIPLIEANDVNTIYVVLESGLAINTYSGDITMTNLTAGVATPPTVAVSGEVILPPPSNDMCAGAINIPVTIGASCTGVTYTTVNGTNSGENTSCFGYTSSADVWFKFTVPASGALNIETTSGALSDGVMQLYSGTCGSLTQIECDDDDGPGTMPVLNLTGLTPNDVLYLMFWEYGGNNNGTFDICAWAPAPPATELDFSASSFSANENNGTINICVDITNPDATNATTADIILTSASAPHLTYATQTVTFPANSSAQQCVAIALTDNTICGDVSSYTFELDNVSGGLNAIEGTSNTTTLNVGDNDATNSTIIDENFSSFGTFTQVSESGNSEVWAITSGAAEINGYNTGSNERDWLIFNDAIDFNSLNNESLVIDYEERYSGDNVEVFYSTNFNGIFSSANTSAATWISIGSLDELSSSSSFNNDTKTFDLTGISGTSVYLGLLYTSTTSNAENWRIDNVELTALECVVVEPEIEIQGNSIEIVDGDSSPSVTDDTDFGSTALAGGTISKTFTILNTGTSDLILTSVASSSADFVVSGTTSGTVTAGNSVTFTVVFDPSVLGANNATITVESDDADEATYTFDITGTGVNSNTSDIIANAAFVYNENIDYTLYQANPITTTANNIEVFQFDIRDGGVAANDADAFGTALTAISFDVANIDNIRNAALFDGTTKVADGTVGATSISFTALSGVAFEAADNSSKTLTLRVSFNTTVTDNDQLQFTVASATASASGSVFAAANAGGATSSIVGDDNRLEVTATTLTFTTQPSTTTINASMATVVVSAIDANASVDLDYVSNVSITSTGTLTGTPVVVAASSGSASFNSLTHTVDGMAFTLSATSGSLTSALSTTFDIILVTYNHGDYRTTSAGTWPSGTATWERYNSVTSTWAAATPASNTTNLLIVRHAVNSRASFAAVSPYTTMIVETGGTFNAAHNCTFGSLTVQDGGVFIASDPSVDIHPTGTITVESGGKLVINSPTLNHADGLFEGTENFEEGSTVEIQDYDNDSTNGDDDIIDTHAGSEITVNADGYYFGNLFINFTPTDDSKALTLVGAVGTHKLCQNDLTIVNNNISKQVQLTNVNANVEIGGNVIVNKFKFSFGAVTSSNLSHTVKGDIIVNGADAVMDLNSNNSGLASVNVDLEGDLIGTAGTMQSDDEDCSITFTNTAIQNIDVAASVPFNRINAYVSDLANVQLLNNDLILNDNSTFTVQDGGTFNFNWASNGTTPLNLLDGVTGTNVFNLNQGGSVLVTSADGISTNAGVGNVQLSNQFLDGDAIYHYIGKVNQTIGNGVPVTARALYAEMENVDQITLSQDLDILAQLVLDRGIIISTPTELLSVRDDATATGASDNSFVDGQIRKIGNDAFVFPVGDASNYQAIAISAPANVTDDFTAQYFQLNPDPTYDRASKDPSIDYLSDCEYWILDRTNGTSDVFVTLTFDNNSCGINDLAELLVARWDGAIWKDHGQSTTSGTLASGTVTSSSAITNFSPFTIGSKPVTTLPVDLLYFNANSSNNKTVETTWTTVTEINNDFFTVERSKDGEVFEFVGKVEGAGNYVGELNYSLVDDAPYDGTSYYRLKQTDFDGQFEYSNVVAVNLSNKSNTTYNVHPIPFNNTLTVNVSNDELVNAIVYDLSGKVIVTDSFVGAKVLDLSNLSAGTYFINLKTVSKTETIKLIKQ